MYKNFIKRFIDLLLSIIVFQFFIILLLVIGPIIYFSDKGNIFYIAPRLGKNGDIFMMYKFRSMKLNSQDIRNEDGSTFNSKNDFRVTGIGKIGRASCRERVCLYV